MITIEIFKLYGSILVDSSKAEHSIAKTEKKAEGLGSKLGTGIATAGKWGLAIGAAAVGVGAAVGGMVMKATDAAGALDDTSKRVGMSAEEYQKYAYAAKLSGIESDKLEGLMKKQQKAFSDAKTGVGKTGEAYQKLGIDISKIGTSGDAFDEVVKKLAGMEDANERNVLANELFGKSYADLLPLLGEGADGIEALKQQAKDAGAVMSNESVAAGAKFGDTLDSIKMAGSGLANESAASLLPMFQKFADWIMKHMPEIREVTKQAFSIIGKVVSTAGKIFEALLPILEPIWDFVSWAFPKILGVVESVFGAIKPIVQGVADVFEAVADAIKWAYDKWMEWTGRKDDKKTKVNDDKGDKEITVYRPHASGIAYVPYDGYKAELHQGERLLTRGEVANSQPNITITVTGNTIASDYDVSRIGNLMADEIAKQNKRLINSTALNPLG